MKGFANQVGGYFNPKQQQGVSNHKVPQQHQIKGRHIQEERLLSEGGFGYIWRAYDINTREVFALKRMICQGEDRVQIAKREMKNLEILPYHQNVVKFYGGCFIPTSDGCIALFLMELCDGGSLFDLMSQAMPKKLPEKKLIHIIHEAAKGIQALHSLRPAVTHRDIKIENILITGGVFKLCDFGSCSSQVIDFRNVPKNQYDQYEEQFNTSTTMMYRPPEMCEPAKLFLVDTKVDVWMLGCVLYTIAFYIHPFVDSSKVAIIDANYRFPPDSPFSEKLHDFIRHMITPDPQYRPSIFDVIQICENYERIPRIQINPVAQSLKDKELARIREEKRFEEKSSKKIKKFDGDIPMDELMKLQQRIRQQNLGGGDDFGVNPDDDDDDDVKGKEVNETYHQQFEQNSQSGSYSFVKKQNPVVKKSAAQRETDRQLEQIKQNFSSNNNNNNFNSSNSNKSGNSKNNNNNNTNNNAFTQSKSNQNNQFSAPNNLNAQNNTSDAWASFGNNSNKNNNTPVVDPFTQFQFNSNSSSNNNNNNSNNNIFDQFPQQQQQSDNIFENFGSNTPISTAPANNKSENIWEFFEDSNSGNVKPAKGSFTPNQQQHFQQQPQEYQFQQQQQQQYQQQSQQQYQQQQQYNAQYDPFAQFSNNQNYPQNQLPPQYSQPQNVIKPTKNVDLLDLDDPPAPKSQNTFNLLDLGLQL